MLPGPPTTGGAERTQPGAEQRRDLHTRTPFQSTSTPNKSPPRKPITPAQLAPRSLTSTVGKPNPYKNLFKNFKAESRGPGPYQRPQKFEQEIVHKKNCPQHIQGAYCGRTVHSAQYNTLKETQCRVREGTYIYKRPFPDDVHTGHLKGMRRVPEPPPQVLDPAVNQSLAVPKNSTDKPAASPCSKQQLALHPGQGKAPRAVSEKGLT
jgi:hypothetical protein